MSQTHLNQLLMMIKDRNFEENEDRRQGSHIGGCGLGGQGANSHACKWKL